MPFCAELQCIADLSTFRVLAVNASCIARAQYLAVFTCASRCLVTVYGKNGDRNQVLTEMLHYCTVTVCQQQRSLQSNAY
jgi:hypothetical protein